MTDDRLTGAALRTHSKAKGPFWEGQARQMLAWAADLIDAADKMAVAPQPAPPLITVENGQPKVRFVEATPAPPREPTEAMIAAFLQWWIGGDSSLEDSEDDRLMARQCWQAMYDAAR